MSGTAMRPERKWHFKTRFRRHAFGWKSQAAIERVRQAGTRNHAGRANRADRGEGAVTFIERLSPALENVDSSSGAIGMAVNNAIAELVPIIAEAPADETTRAAWLERPFDAHGADQIPYSERLADHWGELCGSMGLASMWADRLIGVTRMAPQPGQERPWLLPRHVRVPQLPNGGSALRRDSRTCGGKRVLAMRAMNGEGSGCAATARRCAALRREVSQPWASDAAIDAVCEQVLLSTGDIDDAYARYALTANRAGTYVAWFRAIAKKYPHKPAATILADLVRLTPGDEGKWFAAAKEAKLFDEALALAKQTPCDPRTLTRAARDFAEKHPAFATEAGMAAFHWLIRGHGYEITSADVWAAWCNTMTAARNAGRGDEVRARILALVDNAQPRSDFVAEIVSRCAAQDPQ